MVAEQQTFFDWSNRGQQLRMLKQLPKAFKRRVALIIRAVDECCWNGRPATHADLGRHAGWTVDEYRKCKSAQRAVNEAKADGLIREEIVEKIGGASRKTYVIVWSNVAAALEEHQPVHGTKSPLSTGQKVHCPRDKKSTALYTAKDPPLTASPPNPPEAGGKRRISRNKAQRLWERVDKVRKELTPYDPAGWSRLVGSLPKVARSICEAIGWQALRDGFRDGRRINVRREFMRLLRARREATT